MGRGQKQPKWGYFGTSKSSSKHTSNGPIWLKQIYRDMKFISRGLPGQCGIGYICLTFLHCASLNVSSNHLPESRHSRIGCICLTFLHCASLNVSSNHLPESRHSRIGCIRLTFH